MSDITVRFIDEDGVETSVCASPGQTLMEVAVTNGVDGIIGLCGGMMSCGTCVCRIDDAAAHGFDNPGMEEAELLDSLEAGGQGARLACQCELKAGDDGLGVRV